MPRVGSQAGAARSSVQFFGGEEGRASDVGRLALSGGENRVLARALVLSPGSPKLARASVTSWCGSTCGRCLTFVP